MTIDQLGTLRSITERRVPTIPASMLGDGANGVLPNYFPQTVWMDQSRRYTEYWEWFTGEVLMEIDGYTQENKPVYKYPLQINPVRNFSRKHASILLGEAQDGPDAFVKTTIQPQESLSEKPPTDAAKDLGSSMAKLVNRVWEQSDGRALQQQNATLSQFLGGCVFQLSFVPERDDLLVPLIIKNVFPDFFLPIWNNDDHWDLLEAFVIYRIPTAAAISMYGKVITTKDLWSIYIEHWTKDEYSITINGVPITATYELNGQQATVTFDHEPNPFGFVPFVYIPHLREADFYGSSIIEDIRGLVKELNSALADLGDSVKTTVHRRRYVSNLGVQQPKEMLVGRDNWMINLGTTPPSGKHEPKVTFEDPTTLSEGMAKYPDVVWEALLREGSLSEIFYGKDEGSQRSALTLAFRMLPTTSHARAERAFWESGLNTLARMILIACSRHPELRRLLALEQLIVPTDFRRRFRISQDWASMVPRDREQEANEIILRTQTNRISPELALQKFGDVPNIEDEIQKIKAWMEFTAMLQAKYAAKPGQNGSGDGKGAKTEVVSPVATSGLGDLPNE